LIVVENALKLVVREVFEVLYSPVNAFRKIIEKPDFKGVLLVLVLVISSMVAAQYVGDPKYLYENRAPKNDYWTEAPTNQTRWLSNGLPELDNADFQLGNKDGNHSVTSSVLTETSIWLKLTDIDSIEISEETGYKELFFWIKWINENGLAPSSAKVKLFSGSENSYFESDITALLASSGEWINVTLKIGPDQGWISSNSPDWTSITGIEFRLDWSSSADLIMKIDGLFFRNFLTTIEMGQFGAGIVYGIIHVGMNWILWAGILMIVAKLFQEELGQLNTVFIIIGYVFMVTFVTNIASAVAVSTFPTMTWLLNATATNYYPLDIELWFSNITYQFTSFLIGEAWITALSAVAIRLMKNTTWGKAATISVVAFAIRFILRLFLGF
jgi:hypothetical protein